MNFSEQFVALVEANLGAWLQAFRISYAVYALLIGGLTLILLWRGELPIYLRQGFQAVAILWPLAYLYVLRDIPQRQLIDHFFGWVWPSLCLYALPDFVNILMHAYYYAFGWPTSLRNLQRQAESLHLEQSFLRSRSQMTK